jgi:dUTPase
MQQSLQRDTYGYAFENMTVDDIVIYVKNMKLAIDAELIELLDEVPWKPWTTGRRAINRDAFMGEVVDILHFVVNMALAVSGRSTPTEIADELFTRYTLKNRVNINRQITGYDGVSTKCGGCDRALDDPAVMCTRRGDQGYCVYTNSDINYIDSPRTPVKAPLTPIKPTLCTHCGEPIDRYSCVPPTTERWGHCGQDTRNIAPIKLPTT